MKEISKTKNHIFKAHNDDNKSGKIQFEKTERDCLAKKTTMEKLRPFSESNKVQPVHERRKKKGNPRRRPWRPIGL
jgi:hypothetical protein